MKKTLFKNMTILALMVSTVGVVSCGNTWSEWKVSPEETTDWNFEDHIIEHDKTLFEKRPINELMALAYKEENGNKEIMLDKLNNQFELFYLIGNVSNIKPQIKDIDSYWKDTEWLDFIGYLENYKDNMDITFSYKNNTRVITYPFSESIPKIINGINNALLSANPDGSLPDGSHTFKLEDSDIGPSGEPLSIASVATVGISLMTISIVAELLDVDQSLALRLSKLVNLPPDSFESFKIFMKDMDATSNNLFESSLFKDWSTDKKLINELDDKGNIREDANLKGKFLSEILVRR